jgi:hypothetical protein
MLASPRAAVESPVWDGEFDDDGGENGVFCGEDLLGGILRNKAWRLGKSKRNGAEHVTLRVELTQRSVPRMTTNRTSAS